MPQKFVKAALFLRLRLSSTLVHHENVTFRKRSLNQKKSENAGFVFLWPKNILKMELFRNDGFPKRWLDDNRMASLTELSSNTNKKKTGECRAFKFPRRNVDGSILCVFNVKMPFSNFSGVLWPGKL